MTEREQQIVRALLEALKQMIGSQASEAVLHGAIGLKVSPRVTLAEFEEALQLCDQKGWAIGVPSQVTGKHKWSLSDLGRAALRELS